MIALFTESIKLKVQGDCEIREDERARTMGRNGRVGFISSLMEQGGKLVKVHKCKVILFLKMKEKRLVLAVISVSFSTLSFFCSFTASESEICPQGWTQETNQSYRLNLCFCPPHLTHLTQCEYHFSHFKCIVQRYFYLGK